MAEFKLGRIRLVWKGAWVADTVYYQDDVISLGGKTYICVIGHTSAADFFTDLNIIPSKWNLVSDGQTWKGEWQTSTRYIFNDIVSYGARLYICNTIHTSAATTALGLEADAASWDTFVEGLDWKGNWTTNTKYLINDVVKYGGTTYVCNTIHTSAATTALGLENDLAKWDIFNQGIEYKSNWAGSTRYKINDVVRYGGSLWIATSAHTSTTIFQSDSANWEKFVEGFQYEGEWDAYAEYQPGDIVQYGGNQYIAKTNHTGEVPSTSTANWDLFSEGFKFLEDWGADSADYEYRVGDVVRHGGFTYLCTADHQNQQPPNASYWKKFTSGLNWRGEWIDDQEYFEGDVVRYGDNSYVCVLGHISEGDDYSSIGGPQGGGNEGSRPDLADSGQYWSIIAVGTEQSVLTTTGDMVYYSGSAPTRLPIGVDGQILTVQPDGVPAWESLGTSEDVYYVAEHGVDSPAPIYGKSIDRPWRSIKYACQQVDRGTKNLNAARLLELNRRFIQREVTEWIDYQIGVGSGIWSGFSYNSALCERDTGLIVDALIWDITHGGNVRSREAALAYFENSASVTLTTQADQDVAGYNYMLEVIEAVLTQTDPTTNYQVTNGDNSTAIVEQWTDASLEAEAGVLTRATELVGIITDALTAGVSRDIPAREINTNLIKVSTGKYYEVLPIVVPAETAVMGDELRSTHVLPRKSSNGSLTPVNDVRITYKGVERIEEIVNDIVTGVTVPATTGNAELQNQDWPYAETTVVGPQVSKLARTIKRQIDYQTNQKVEATYTPAYNLTDANYGYSRDLFLLNKDFIKAEIEAFLDEEYPDLNYSRTTCLRDVGLIMDAVAYDLTYGGNWMSVEAGKSYYNGSTNELQIETAEKTATIASMGYLSSLMQTTGRNITVNPTYQTPATVGDVSTVPVPQVSGTGGSAGVSTVIGNLIDDVITVIRDGYNSAPTITYPTIATDSDAYTAQTALNSAKTSIQTGTIDFISKNFGSFRYDSSVCRRDLTNILTDVAYDIALGTNYNAIVNGLAYQRPTNAYNLANEKTQTIGAIRYARDTIEDELSDSTAITRSNAAFNEIVDIIANGSGNADTLTYPAPSTLPSTDADDALAQLVANKTFIQAEIVGWIQDQVTYYTTTVPTPASIWYNFSYDTAKCSRDVGFIVEAMKYDIIYGGTMATTRIAESYFGIDGTAYPASETDQTSAAYGHLSDVLGYVVRAQTSPTWTKSPNNAETQDTGGTAAGVTEANALAAKITIITDAIDAGNTASLPAVTYPNLASLNVSATLQSEKSAVDSAKAQTILDTIQYISDTYNDFNYNHAKCSRDVGLIIDAAVYDWATGSNFAGMIAGYSYARAPSSNVISDQKTASIAAFEYARQQVLSIVESYGSHPQGILAVNNTFEWIDDFIFSANAEGGNEQVDDFEVYNAIRQLELNKDFITAEVHAYMDYWFSIGVTSSNTSNNELTVADTSWLKPNQAIRFVDLDDSTGSVVDAGLALDTTYYVKDITSSTTLTVSVTPGGSAVSLTTENSGFIYDHEKCRRDTSYIIDGVSYDMVLNTNYNQVVNGRSYVGGSASEVLANEKTETIAGINYAKSLAANLYEVRNDATALARSNAAFTEIVDIINNGAGAADSITFNVPTGATTGQQNAVLQLQANRSFIQGEITAWIQDPLNYPSLVYDVATCERDVGYIVDALCYDILYGGNSATIQVAKSYFIGAVSQLPAGEKTPTYLAYNYMQSFIDNIIEDNTSWTPKSGGSQDTSNGPGTSTESNRAITLIEIIEDVIQADSLSGLPSTNYPNVSFATQGLRDAQVAMFNNKEDIIIKTTRYIDDTYAQMFRLEMDYDYNINLCSRDVGEFVYAMKYDLTWAQQWKREYTDNVTLYRPASYKTRIAAEAYVNAVTGSQEENMFLMRNGTGLRNMTLDGLDGYLTYAGSAYGTPRVTAGAYASLDPGWGPNDEKAWITSRSPFMQSCTCFGNCAIGQKIDGALHNGGYDSMVSNDFTQLISDGIGAWVTNNGRAELVSVFTYYSSVGYLAENGGRIRATNGNNSYGRYGSVAEGTDVEETPITGIVDNRFQYNATIAIVNTNTDTLQNIEFSHAGNEYTEAEIEFFGPGSSEVVIADEFRDGAVFQGGIDEINDSSGAAGGSGYLVVSNTAQAGSTTGITLAATDGNLSTAYPGMRIQIVGGAGIGLYGIVDTYNAGSKAATVVRESDGAAGWDHIVPGTPFVSPNSTSVYEIEPYVSFTAPPKASGAAVLPATTTWYDATYVETSAEYTNVSSSTESDGTGATFDITRNGSKYYVSINTAGTGYSRLDTLSIHGSSVGGANSTHDITITVTTVNSTTGAIIDFDFDGYGRKGRFLAVGAGTNGAFSLDGQSWSAEALPAPSAGNWNSIASGLQDDGSTTYHESAVVIVADGSNDVIYGSDADTWSTGVTLPAGMSSAGEKNIAYGNVVGTVNNRFVVISDDDRDVAYSDNGGASWTLTTNALPAIGYTDICYGKGLWVAVDTGSTNIVYSSDGITWAAASIVPGTVAGNVAWGNGRFVVVGGTNGVMYSLDGDNWYDPEDSDGNALTLNLVATERKVTYGQGVFVITSDDTDQIEYSQDGLVWTAYTLSGGTVTGGFNSVAFGNPDKTGIFAILPNSSSTAGRYANIGATTRARVGVANEQVYEIRLYEPGSGYPLSTLDANYPEITVTDPNNINDVIINVRVGNGAIANPTFVNRGSGFISSSATVNSTTSNGYADFLQNGNYIAVRQLTERPVAGSNVEFASLPGQYFKLVNTVSFLGSNDGSYTAFLQISPNMEIADAPPDSDPIEMHIRFSQVRLTGHDFLDIGSGNFEDTNYPGTPVNTPDQTKETSDFGGGRVFYTATDQDGNFRVGDLFSIEQATGVATLNAEAFNIAGLQELTLGEVTLGGNSASITEFSTDPFFTANSDTIVPTQRAVKAYIEAQIGGGGASLVVNSVTAGDVFIGSNLITTVTGNPINIKGNIVFSGTVLGLPLAYNYFLK